MIFAGEAVFILPFIVPRIFRPTYLGTFDLTNTELGYCFSIYGIVALISYFLGGFVADRLPPGRLMSIGLFLTALGGIYAAQYPSLTGMYFLYGYWGLTTILLFWAALIKATRVWGGTKRQGKAFGFLDGGRGLVAAGFGSLGLLVISLLTAQKLELYDLSEKKEIFSMVILVFSAIVGFVSLLLWIFYKTPKSKSTEEVSPIATKAMISSLLRIKSIYFIAIIILTGYSGYKVTDIFSLYARDIMNYDEIKAAGIGTILLYIRPILGVSIGFLADWKKPSLFLSIGFLIMAIGSLVFASGIIDSSVYLLFFISIIATSIGVYGIRCLYFAVLEEVSIPLHITGTAVGFVSVVGYTPDIFMGPIIGYFLDDFPMGVGYQYLFGFIGILSVLGLLSSIYISFITRVKS